MSSKLFVPIAILLAGGLIAFAIVNSDTASSPTTVSTRESTRDSGTFGNSLSAGAKNIRPVTNEDHIRGNPNAPVTIVEFSDFECPFCRRIHPTLNRTINEFDDEVRWVFRHFPLTSIHSRAQGAAIASECVARLGGNEAFWQFADFLFENQNRLGSSLYRQFAQGAEIPGDELDTCLASQDTLTAVNADLQDAIDSGGRGTPYVVVINEAGELFPFSGALPYTQVRRIILQALES